MEEKEKLMNIAINGRYLSARYITGVERVADNLSQSIPVLDNKNRYYIFADKNSTLKKEYLKIKNLTWVDFTFSKRSFILKHFQEHILLPRVLIKYNIDLLFNPTNTAPLGFLKKSVTLIHCLHFFVYPKEYNPVFRWYYHWLLPKVIRKSKQIVTISELSKQEINKYLKINTKNIPVIYNGINYKFFQKTVKKKKYILFVGSLNPRKNLAALVDAYLRSSIKNTYQLIVAGNAVGSFKKINKDLSVKYISNLDDTALQKLYREASLFVFPSKHEGFGLPPVEAMASGTPVIGSDIPAIKEICGAAIYYVNPNSIKSIKSGIEKVLSNKKLQNELIRKGRTRSNLFIWERAAKQYIELFNSLY